MSVNTTLLNAKRQEIVDLTSQYDALNAKGASALTADEVKSLGSLPDEIDKLTTEYEASVEADKKVARARGLFTGAGPGAGGGIGSVASATTNDLMRELALKNDIVDKLIAGRSSWDGKAGTELLGRSAFGKMVPMESEGWCVEPEKWKKVCEPSYMKSFETYMRLGEAKMSEADRKTLSEGSDSAGGYLVPPEFIARLIARKPYPTRILEFVETVPCSSDQVIFPRLNFDSDTADTFSAANPRMQWVGEKGPTPTETDMAFGNVTIPVFTGQFFVEVTRNLTEDGAIPIALIIQKFASQAYDLGLDNVIVSGDGNAKPTGFLTNAGAAGLFCPTVNCGNPVTANGLTGLVYGLPPQYSDTDGVAAVMNRTSAFATFAQIQDTSGQYIFGLARQNGPEGMAVPRRAELFGYPIVFSAFMPNVAGAATPVAFGDWKETYTLCQRVGLSVFAYGEQDKSMLTGNKIGWLFRFRAGGMVSQNRSAHVGKQS